MNKYLIFISISSISYLGCQDKNDLVRYDKISTVYVSHEVGHYDLVDWRGFMDSTRFTLAHRVNLTDYYNINSDFLPKLTRKNLEAFVLAGFPEGVLQAAGYDVDQIKADIITARKFIDSNPFNISLITCA